MFLLTQSPYSIHSLYRIQNFTIRELDPNMSLIGKTLKIIIQGTGLNEAATIKYAPTLQHRNSNYINNLQILIIFKTKTI